MNETQKDYLSEVVIKCSNVSVKYRVIEEDIVSLKDFALKLLRSNINYKDIWALKNTSMEVREGEVVGIVGDNGAGKSTLLKVAAGVIPPTTGRVIVKGKISTILGLSAGLDTELTGRENIYLVGALLGFSRREMEDKFDGIVSFAEMSDFIDIPLRTYSDGMVARLAFAIATDIEPEILLIDESFVVGDISFRAKCYARIENFRKKGKTILIVSHDLSAVSDICSRTIWLDRGEIVMDGDSREVVQRYSKLRDG